MKSISILTNNIFWIPLLLGGGLATLLFGFIGSGEESVLGLGSFGDSIVGIALIFIGVWVLARMPGKIIKHIIGWPLLGFGLYIIINVIGVM